VIVCSPLTNLRSGDNGINREMRHRCVRAAALDLDL
jgi:hypothetical protein